VAHVANRRIFDLGEGDSSLRGMGTTLTGALVAGDEVTIVHVGDSRAYLMRDGELRQLTRDHSLVEELRRQGRLTSEEAEEHPQRSVVTRALGVEPDVQLDVHTHQARSGDLFLLCSDGLTSMVRQDRMQEIVASSPSLQKAADRLVAEANEMGGRDNITVVLFRLGGDDGERRYHSGGSGRLRGGPRGEAGGDLAGPRAAHAVRNREGRRARIERVLVRAALPPGIRPRGLLDNPQHENMAANL